MVFDLQISPAHAWSHTSLLSRRIVSTPKIHSSSGKQCTNSPFFEISAPKSRFSLFDKLSTRGQFALPTDAELRGPFWSRFVVFGNLRFFGFLVLAAYVKAGSTSFWWSKTVGNGRNHRYMYRWDFLVCLICVLVQIRCVGSPCSVFSLMTGRRIQFFLLREEWTNEWVLVERFSNNFAPTFYVPQVSVIRNE